MNAPNVSSEPSLFDHAFVAEGRDPLLARAEGQPEVLDTAVPASEELLDAMTVEETATPTVDDDSAASDALDSGASVAAPTQVDRKRLAEQLDALKRKEFELRRALAATDHPELAETIRLIEGRAFNVSRAEAKLAQGFSKSEARRREVIEKKLGTLRDKRAELDNQIGALEAELSGLGADRLATFQSERQQALEQLLVVLATHEAALSAVGLVPARLVPEIEGWLPELEALASKLSSATA